MTPVMLPSCRVCGCNVEPLFQKQQLDKYAVTYFKCSYCGSCQTETPYWTEEAYNNFTFAIDTGMVARTLKTGRLALALALEKNFSSVDICLDIGGGTGLFTRYLRDFGLNAFWNDKFAKNVFALGFEKEIPVMSPKLITAFEVFEHFVDPKRDIGALFEMDADYYLFSTKLYQNQDENWWYFLADGQHVEFYSQKGLELIGTNYRYHLTTDGSTFHLFSKEKLPANFVKHLLRRTPKVERKAEKRWPSRTLSDSKLLLKPLS